MAAGFLDKERIIAGPGFNRWLVPPAALAFMLSGTAATRLRAASGMTTDATLRFRHPET